MYETKTIQGVTLPSVGLGTYGLNGRECENAIGNALAMGYRHIDTAQMYGNEECIGVVLKHTKIAREDLFITTKVWPSNYAKSRFMHSVEQSLRQLQVEQVDLLLLHWPSDQATNNQAIGFLDQCKRLGYAKHIGVSNFNREQLEVCMQKITVFCNQIQYHPLSQNTEMLRLLQSNDILLTAYSPLSVGELVRHPVLKSIGTRYHRSASQVVLRWLIQQPNMVAIPKAASREHQKENLNIFDFELNEEDVMQLNLLSR